jgi:biotin operon repressor
MPSGRYRYLATIKHERSDSIGRNVESGPVRATPWEAAVDAMAILDRLRNEPSSIALWYYLRIGGHPQNVATNKYLRRLHGGLGTAAPEVRREAVIRVLAASDGPMLGETVAEATGLSRFQVRRVLDTLVMEGVATYARRKGYRLTARSDQKTG